MKLFKKYEGVEEWVVYLSDRLVASLSSIPIGGSCMVGVHRNGNGRGKEGRGAQESLGKETFIT